MFLGWVFLTKQDKYMVGILFYAHILRRIRPFPFVLFLVYFDLNLTNLVIIGLIILILLKY